MGALSHIRVLDLTRVLAGPWCAQTLADFGADVIKVERPEVGDDTRHWGPPYLKTPDGADTHEAAYYLAANRNKRSVTVDIATPEGQRIIRELAAQSDVVLENYKVGQLKKYGLDYASLKEAKPDIVYCSVTGFGQTGPYAQRAGYDFIVQGIGGFMSITGERDGLPGGGPQKAGVAIADLMTGMYSTIAVLTALTHRDRTGEGQYIDMALLDVQVAMLANMNSNFLASGQSPVRWATRTRTSCRIRLFRPATAGSSLPWAMMGSSANSSKPADGLSSLTTSASPPTRSACAIATCWCRSWRRWSARWANSNGFLRSKPLACPAARSTIWQKCSRTSRSSREACASICRIRQAAR
jgi:crotonobetainyl-CoA:carnitine CoA-transferase CaiB-like acyl-CoA transferase